MKLKYTFIGGSVLVAVALLYYAVSPLFKNIKVDEAVPYAQESGDVENQGVPASVTGTPGHPASGMVRVITTESKSYVRFENFKTINGPDLYVYLAKDLQAKDFVNLGALRATEGNVNYEIPQGVNLKEYPYVITWCEQFGVLFNYADISGTN